jgi:hypothetical protein
MLLSSALVHRPTILLFCGELPLYEFEPGPFPLLLLHHLTFHRLTKREHYFIGISLCEWLAAEVSKQIKPSLLSQ